MYPLPPHPISQLLVLRDIALLLQRTFCPVKFSFPAALCCQMLTRGHAFNLFCYITRRRPWNIVHVLSAHSVRSGDTYRIFILVRIFIIRFRRMCRMYRKCILSGHLKATPMRQYPASVRFFVILRCASSRLLNCFRPSIPRRPVLANHRT